MTVIVRAQDWDRDYTWPGDGKTYEPWPETEWHRPEDRDEARRWTHERALEHIHRGVYSCTMRGEPFYECTRGLPQCCQGGELVVKPGWRKVRVASTESGDQ